MSQILSLQKTKTAYSLFRRSLLWLYCLTSVMCLLVPGAHAQPADVDDVSQQATTLEAELGKYKDNAPEAGEALLRLTALYYDNGRLFGLVRSAQRFVAAHPSHPKHAAAMLQLLDGLEALSRNREFTVIARQFLTRYPKSSECPGVEVRLAYMLQKLGEAEDAAVVYRDRWRREMNKNGREFGEKACLLFLRRVTTELCRKRNWRKKCLTACQKMNTRNTWACVHTMSFAGSGSGLRQIRLATNWSDPDC